MKKTLLLIQIAILFLAFTESYSQSGWFSQISGTATRLYGISFTDANTGTAVGENGRILRTTNGGTNWTLQTSGITTNLFSVSFTDANTGTAVGENGRIHRTINGGVTFVNQVSSEIPERFSLYQNYPNSFNPATKINFDIPKNGYVTLKVYNLLGKEVQTLVSRDLKSGSYTVDFNASKLTSGVYFYRLQATPKDGQAGDFVETRKMVLVK